MALRDIQEVISSGKHCYSEHAVKRMIQRNIEPYEVEHTIFKGEIIEEYPHDKYSSSCLIYGKTKKGKNLHVQVSLPPKVVIITIYEPNPFEWVDYRMRR
ncbi:DUF4258 domain-containing protein [bacterium]|nr:DUF4258 domain-containing protein [bacterium]